MIKAGSVKVYSSVKNSTKHKTTRTVDANHLRPSIKRVMPRPTNYYHVAIKTSHDRYGNREYGSIRLASDTTDRSIVNDEPTAISDAILCGLCGIATRPGDRIIDRREVEQFPGRITTTEICSAACQKKY